jgi:hypothetical protein
MPVIPATQEAEIGKAAVPGKSRQKTRKTTHLNKQARYDGTCSNPNYAGGIGRRMEV